MTDKTSTSKDFEKAVAAMKEWFNPEAPALKFLHRDHELMQKHVRYVLRSMPENKLALATQIEILWSTASVSEACEALETFIDYGYDTEEFNISAHYLFHENGEYKKALPYLKREARKSADYMNKALLAHAYFETGDFENAELMRRKSISLGALDEPDIKSIIDDIKYPRKPQSYRLN